MCTKKHPLQSTGVTMLQTMLFMCIFACVYMYVHIYLLPIVRSGHGDAKHILRMPVPMRETVQMR